MREFFVVKLLTPDDCEIRRGQGWEKAGVSDEFALSSSARLVERGSVAQGKNHHKKSATVYRHGPQILSSRGDLRMLQVPCHCRQGVECVLLSHSRCKDGVRHPDFEGEATYAPKFVQSVVCKVLLAVRLA